MELFNIGFGNMLAKDKMVIALTPESAPVRRIVQDAKEKNNLIDATCGRRTQSVIITNSNHVVLSALPTHSILSKFVSGSQSDKG